MPLGEPAGLEGDAEMRADWKEGRVERVGCTGVVRGIKYRSLSALPAEVNEKVTREGRIKSTDAAQSLRLSILRKVQPVLLFSADSPSVVSTLDSRVAMS